MIAILLALLVTPVAQPQNRIGQRVAPIELIDDQGRTRSIDELRGQPLVIAPIYSRCPLACPLIASTLKRAAVNGDTPPATYRVLVFSFDERDTPADLRRFRERHRLPIGWMVATAARREDIRRFTDSIGFSFATVKGGYTHPNLVVVTTDALETAASLNGTNYSSADLDRAIAVARGGVDWVARYGRIAIALLLFVATISAAYLVMLIGARRSHATASG